VSRAPLIVWLAVALAAVALAWTASVVIALPAALGALLARRGAVGIALTGFVALGYFGYGVMEMVAAPAERAPALLLCLLALALLGACAEGLRRRTPA
jgi:uncharacterized membrane protein